MAHKRSLQQYLEADDDRKGKKAVIEDDEEKGSLKQANLIINQKVDTESSKQDSSSESEIEDEEEGLDIWEREARRMFSPREENTGWRPWTLQELAMIEMGVLASTLEAAPDSEEVPNGDTDEVPVAADVATDDGPVIPVAPDATNVQHASADAQVTDADLSSVPLQTN